MGLEAFAPENDPAPVVVLLAEGRLDEFASENEGSPAQQEQQPARTLLSASTVLRQALHPFTLPTSLRWVAAGLAAGALAASVAGWQRGRTPSSASATPPPPTAVSLAMGGPALGPAASTPRTPRAVAAAVTGDPARTFSSGVRLLVLTGPVPGDAIESVGMAGTQPVVEPELAAASVGDVPPLMARAEPVPALATADSPTLSTVVDAVAPDPKAAVNSVLTRFQGAYGHLDAAGAKAVWPSVDERALARAFGNLESQTLTFDHCEIHMGTSRANADCDGITTYVGKPRNVEQNKRTNWNFLLEKSGDDWQIKTLAIH